MTTSFIKKSSLFLSLVGLTSVSQAATIITDNISSSLWSTTKGANITNVSSTSAATDSSAVDTALSSRTELTWYGGYAGAYDPSFNVANSDTDNLAVSLSHTRNNTGGGSWAGTKSDTFNTGYFADFQSLTLSFDVIGSVAVDTSGFASLYYKEVDSGSFTLLKSANYTFTNSITSVNLALNETELQALSQSGQLYFVFGTTGTSLFTIGSYSNMSLTGERSIPEPSTITLGILSLTGLLMRRRRKAS